MRRNYCALDEMAISLYPAETAEGVAGGASGAEPTVLDNPKGTLTEKAEAALEVVAEGKVPAEEAARGAALLCTMK